MSQSFSEKEIRTMYEAVSMADSLYEHFDQWCSNEPPNELMSGDDLTALAKKLKRWQEETHKRGLWAAWLNRRQFIQRVRKFLNKP